MKRPSEPAAAAPSPVDEAELLVDLTELECKVVRAVRRGRIVDCDPIPMAELATTDDPRHTVRGRLIRELLLGRHGELDPRGVRLANVRIDGEVDLSHIRAQAVLAVTRSVFNARCQLSHARLSHLILSGSHLVALHADGIQVEGSVFLRDGFRATGAGELGAVRLVNAHIHSNLEMDGAELANDTGAALDACGVRVGGSVFLRGGFTAAGAGDQGAIRLLGAHIHRDLDMTGATLTNNAGPALDAGGLQVNGRMFLSAGFRATCTSERAAVRLPGAHVQDLLSMSGATINQEGHGLVVDLERVTVGYLKLPLATVCAGGAATATSCSSNDRQVGLDGLAYGALSGIEWRQWVHLVRHHSPTYAAQPYQHLATVERARGHDGPARRILIAQQDDLRRRGNIGGWRTRFMHWAWGKVAGYGYRTSRLITALLLAIITAGALGVLAGHIPIRDGRYVAAHTARAEQPNTPCSLIEQIGLGIDRGLPLGATGLRERCDLDTTSRRGQALTAAIWSVQALVWALATLAVAGYTGLIRKIS